MPVISRLIALALLPLLAPLAVAERAFAADATGHGPAVLVFDGSGSMWGNIGSARTPKFEMARDAVAKSLSTLSPRVQLGLMSFGHRRRADCNDIEVMAQPEAGPPERITELVARISPKGKGPLSSTMKQAAKLIPADAEGSIIAIHDGTDNCWQDPCAAAAEIAKTNPKTRIFLIGFGMPRADAEQLACVARETNGRVFETHEPHALETAIADALTLANLELVDPATGTAVPAPQAATPPKPAGAPGLRLSAALKSGGPALAAPLAWTVAKSDKPAEAIASARVAELALDLDPGSYVVSARLGEVSAQETVEVKSDGPTQSQLALGAGIVKLEARADKDGAPLADPLITVFEKADGSGAAGRPVWIGREARQELVLPAGSYLVRVQDGLTQQTAEVTLAAGAEQPVTPVLGSGQLTLSAVAAASGVALEAVSYIIEEDDPDSPQGRREVVRSADPRASFTLPAGTYYVTAQAGAAEARDRIALGSGDVVQHVARFNLVKLTVVAALPGASEGAPANPGPLVIRILSTDTPEREIARVNATPGDFQLPPARYKVEASIAGNTIRSVGSVDLSSGRDMTVQIKLESGEVAVVGATLGRHWRIKDGNGRTVLHSGPGQATTARLAPGRYVLVADGDERPSERDFEVKAGERQSLDVGAP